MEFGKDVESTSRYQHHNTISLIPNFHLQRLLSHKCKRKFQKRSHSHGVIVTVAVVLALLHCYQYWYSKLRHCFFYTHIFCTLKLLKFIKNYWQTISHLVTCIQALFYSIKDKNVICPYRTMSFLEYYRKSTWDIGHELDATFFLQKTDHFYILQG